MKLVLCGNHGDYDQFIDVLYRRDRLNEEYVYISHPRDIRGHSPEARIVKLRSFQNHPQRNEIMDICRQRYDMRSLEERNRDRYRGVYGQSPIESFQSGRVFQAPEGIHPIPIPSGYTISPEEAGVWGGHQLSRPEPDEVSNAEEVLRREIDYRRYSEPDNHSGHIDAYRYATEQHIREEAERITQRASTDTMVYRTGIIGEGSD